MSVKDKVFTLLKSTDTDCSGAVMAKSFGVSRNAIHKAIATLRQEGCLIESSHMGYRLVSQADFLSKADIEYYLDEKYSINISPSLPSTNHRAKQMALDGAAHNTVIIANEQSEGVGRQGRSFYSPPDSGIYMSIILRVNFSISDSSFITSLTALAVCKAIELTCGISPKIKWVNDIFLNQKKVCGILTEIGGDLENFTLNYAVVGIGLNFSTSSFPAYLSPIAASLCTGDPPCSRNRLIAEILNQISQILQNDDRVKHFEGYKSRSMLLGKKIVILHKGAEFTATAQDITYDCRLKVQRADGSFSTFSVNEITIKEILHDQV